MNYQYYQNYQNPYMNLNNNNSNSMIWVQGESGAKAYPIAPGSSVALFDSEKDRFFIKSADNSGMPLPLRIFNFTEQKESSQLNNIHDKSNDYVTRKEFNELLDKINNKNQYVRKEKSNNGKSVIQRDAE